jgi:DEAD/DEAH box helicase domain-containing protein
VLHPVPGPAGKRVFHWATDAYPANHVSLRSIGWDNFVIIDVEAQASIAEMDFRSAHTMLHEQAIYQHDAEQFQVEKLDFENHKAFVRKVAPDYFTDAMSYTKVSVMAEERQAPVANVECGWGEVSLVEKVVGYKKIKFYTHENAGYGEVTLPEMQMHTTAFWLTMPEGEVRARKEPRPAIIEALRGINSALHTVACLGLMIDPRDLGRTLGSKSEPEGPPRKDPHDGAGFDPTLFLYDNIPGGVGLAARLFEEREDLLRRCRSLLEGCSCNAGCPACIGPELGAVSAGPSARKSLARELLTALGTGR